MGREGFASVCRRGAELLGPCLRAVGTHGGHSGDQCQPRPTIRPLLGLPCWGRGSVPSAKGRNPSLAARPHCPRTEMPRSRRQAWLLPRESGQEGGVGTEGTASPASIRNRPSSCHLPSNPKWGELGPHPDRLRGCAPTLLLTTTHPCCLCIQARGLQREGAGAQDPVFVTSHMCGLYPGQPAEPVSRGLSRVDPSSSSHTWSGFISKRPECAGCEL